MSLSYLLKLLLLAPRYARQSQKNGDNRFLLTISFDIVSMYLKYKMKGNTYLKKSIGTMSDAERSELLEQLRFKKEYYKKYYENWKFLNKYTGLEWQKSSKKIKERAKAYIKRYHTGKHCTFQYGVTFIFEHYHVGKLIVGDHVLFARDVDVDITGDLTIGDGVAISEGAKILTHSHDVFHSKNDMDLIPLSNRAYETPLKIGKNVRIGAHAIIMPGVKEIGDNSFISAGAIVTKSVPERVVIAGNPAQVIVKIPKKVNVEQRD